MTNSFAPDPFSALRAVDRDIEPTTAFSRQLRARLERGADLPEGVVMSGVTTRESAPTEIVERPGALPYLAVADGAAAIDWYQANLEARLRGEPIMMDDGRVGHAELEIGGGAIYLAAAFPEIGLAAPAPGAVSVSLMVAVADTDRALTAARTGGATVAREPYEAHDTRTAVIIDPFGHRWMLSGPVRESLAPVGDVPATDASGTESVRAGDIGYVSLWTPDAERAATFYESVLGWTVDRDSRQVTNLGHRLGLFSVAGARGLFMAYAVDDLDAARAAIEDAGGSVTAESGEGSARLDAVDNQGVAFSVHVPDADAIRGEQHPAGHGELTYLTVRTRDSAALRSFYTRVLGWDYTPGRINDGWEVTDSRPMTGIAGGAADPSAVAMWTVDDIESAVQRVVAAGGRIVADPRREPYATVAECIDDQGVVFYLGQY